MIKKIIIALFVFLVVVGIVGFIVLQNINQDMAALDAVSGATYSSKVILLAISDALNMRFIDENKTQSCIDSDTSIDSDHYRDQCDLWYFFS